MLPCLSRVETPLITIQSVSVVRDRRKQLPVESMRLRNAFSLRTSCTSFI